MSSGVSGSRAAGALPEGSARSRPHRSRARGDAAAADVLIAAGYEDADDCDALREIRCSSWRRAAAGDGGSAMLAATMSRLENAPSKIEIARMMAAMVDLSARAIRDAEGDHARHRRYARRVHGHQQLSLFNAITTSAASCNSRLRGGERQAGGGHPARGKDAERRGGPRVIKQVTAASAATGQDPHLLARRQHYAGRRRWTGARRMASIMSSGSPATTCCTPGPRRRRQSLRAPRRGWRGEASDLGAFDYAAKSWAKPRRVIARLEATARASTRATSSPRSRARPGIFTRPSTARAARPRTSSSCTRASSPPTALLPQPNANQFRLILHTAAYWLLHTLRAAAPNARAGRPPSSPPAASAAQNRSPRHRRCRAHPRLPAHGLPRRRDLSNARRTLRRRRAVISGALSPREPVPQPSTATQSEPRSASQPTPRLGTTICEKSVKNRAPHRNSRYRHE